MYIVTLTRHVNPVIVLVKVLSIIRLTSMLRMYIVNPLPYHCQRITHATMKMLFSYFQNVSL